MKFHNVFSFIPILAYFLCFWVSSQAQSPESDALFAQGVEKYQKGKFKDAEILFRKCWALDSIEMPETSFRREYSKEWLSSSLWHQNKKAESQALDPFGFDIEPIDRRLTCEIDRHMQEGSEASSPQMYEMKIKFAISEAERTFGKEHSCIASLNCHLATFYLSWNDMRNAVKHIKIAEEIFNKSGSHTTFIPAMVALIRGKAEFTDGHIDKAWSYACTARQNFQGLATKCPFQYSRLLEFFTDVCFAKNTPEDALTVIDDAWKSLLNAPESESNQCFDLIYAIINCQSAIDASDDARMDAMFAQYYRILEAFAITLPEYPYEGKAAMLERHAELLLARGNTSAAWDKICEAEAIIKEYTSLSDTEIADLYLCKGQILSASKQYSEAYDILAIAADGFKNRGKDWAKPRIVALQYMATAKSALGDDAAALSILDSLIDQMNREGTFSNMDYARIYSDLSHIHSRTGDLPKAINYLLKAKAEYEKEENLFELANYAMVIRNLIASKYTDLDAEKELDNLHTLANKADPLTAICVEGTIFNCRAHLATAENDPVAAIDYAQKAIDIFANTQISVPLDFSDDLRILYEASGNLSHSLETALSRVKNFEDSNVQNLSYVYAIMDASGMASACLDFALAKDLMLKAIEVLHNGKTNYPDQAYYWLIYSLAEGMVNVGDIALADDLINESEAYYYSKLVPRQNFDWWTITRIKLALAKQNNEEALKLASSIEKDLESARKEGNQNLYISGMGVIAKAYTQTGNLAKANDIYLSILPQTPPENPDDFSMQAFVIVQDYIGVLNSLGETDKSAKWSLFVTNLLTSQSDSNQNINNIFSSIQTAFNIYQNQGAQEAEVFINEFTDNIVAQHGLTSTPANAAKSIQINFLLNVYGAEKAFKSGKDFMQAMRAEGKIPTSDFIIAYSDAARIAGNLDEAKSAIDLFASSLIAPTQQQQLQILTRNALLSALRSDFDDALTGYRKAFDDGKQFVLHNFLTMSARERTNFWNNNVGFFKMEIPMVATMAKFTPAFSELAYDAALFSTSLLLASDLTIEQTVKSTSDRMVKQAYSQFLKAKAIANQNEMSESSDIDKIRTARADAENAEKHLLNLLADKVGNYNSALKVDWKDVQRHLKPDEAAVEFVMAKDDRGIDYYYAVTLLGDDESPVAVPLFYMNEPYSAWANCYTDESLTQSLWMPLASRLEGKAKVWFAPQGQLTVTAIESMPGLEKVTGRDDTQFCRLTSTRELALGSDASSSHGSATIYGGLNYSADSEILIKDAFAYGLSGSFSKQRDFDPELLFAAEDDGRSIGRRRIPYLEGTLHEADFLESLLKNKKLSIPMRPNVLKAEKGTEASFKALSGKAPTLLHIGTHGFFISDNKSSTFKFFEQSLNTDSSPEDRAMLRAGLLFAGAENTLYGNTVLPDDVDDGVLTAKEIAALNLQGTDLTVLSACETALGELNADGVFGLQRGFKKAGAGALLMTLWKVNDQATTLLMKEFYTNWLLIGMNKYSALEAAKSSLRNSSEWHDPKYWAPFILLDAN